MLQEIRLQAFTWLSFQAHAMQFVALHAPEKISPCSQQFCNLQCNKKYLRNVACNMKKNKTSFIFFLVACNNFFAAEENFIVLHRVTTICNIFHATLIFYPIRKLVNTFLKSNNKLNTVIIDIFSFFHKKKKVLREMLQ